MSKYLKTLLTKINNPDAAIVSEGIKGADVTNFIDTGSYVLNALFSGSIYGGLPGNKISCFAGDPATGKTFYAIGIARQFLQDNKDGVVVYFDTEQAVTTDMFSDRGVDVSRIAVIPVSTIEEFKTQALQIVNEVIETPEEDRKPMFMILDSLGMLSTEKEMQDSSEGKNVRDMTKAQQNKAAFRVLTMKLGKAQIPMLLTNHTYQVIGSYVPTKDLGGGVGLKYAASTIVMLSKSKDKTEDGVIGNFIKCTNYKNRFTKENMSVETRLNYSSGLSRYYGLTDFAIKYNIFKKVSTRIELPDGTKVFEKNIDEDPEKYFTKEVLNKIDEEIQKDFKYGMKKDAE
jgi:RecA/RadA recombinase